MSGVLLNSQLTEQKKLWQTQLETETKQSEEVTKERFSQESTFAEQQQAESNVQANMPEISANKIATSGDEPELLMPTAITMEGSFMEAEEKENGSFKNVSDSLKAYFEKRGALNDPGNMDDASKASVIRDLIGMAGELKTQCFFYTAHHHPLSKRGRDRFEQILTLQRNVEEEMSRLRQVLSTVSVSKSKNADK